MQAQHTQALQKQLDQLSAEVAAQRLALAAATSERDGARAAAFETSERLGVSAIVWPVADVIQLCRRVTCLPSIYMWLQGPFWGSAKALIESKCLNAVHPSSIKVVASCHISWPSMGESALRTTMTGPANYPEAGS